jgi:hypothetical protein
MQTQANVPSMIFIVPTQELPGESLYFRASSELQTSPKPRKPVPRMPKNFKLERQVEIWTNFGIDKWTVDA